MTPDIQEKLKTKMAKLAIFLIKNNITKQEMLDACMDDPAIQDSPDIIGPRMNYFEWRVNPTQPMIECSTEGDIRINGEIQTPKNYRGYKTIKYVRGKKTYDIDVALTVLGTYRPMPTDGMYTVGFRDENPNNCRIQNLYWKLQGK